MAMESLKYLSRQTSDFLIDSINENLDRYREGDFLDLASEGGWAIDMSLKADLSPLEGLVKAKESDAEINNSVLVWKALHHLAPALACENRFWTRLTHIECLEYSRYRWLDLEADDDVLVRDINKHFFANTQTRYRDDNAISRLWWNAYIAKLAAPDNQEQALKMILRTADIRSNFIERSKTASRAALASGIVRAMMNISWITDKEINFRRFMSTLNRLGGGKVFEFWTESRLDDFMLHCSNLAQQSVDSQVK